MGNTHSLIAVGKDLPGKAFRGFTAVSTAAKQSARFGSRGEGYAPAKRLG